MNTSESLPEQDTPENEMQFVTRVLIQEDSIEIGNVLRIRDTATHGSVLATYPDRIDVRWSDGYESVERYPIRNIDFY